MLEDYYECLHHRKEVSALCIFERKEIALETELLIAEFNKPGSKDEGTAACISKGGGCTSEGELTQSGGGSESRIIR